MSFAKCQWATLVFAIGAFGVTGCGKKSSLNTVPVTGTVTLDGQPVANALVTLNPSNPDGKAASGRSDAAGQFKVSTFVTATETKDGALPGDYTVTVTQPPVGTLQAPPGGPAGMSKEQMMQMSGRPSAGGAGDAAPQPSVQVPAIYADAQQSGLTATVTSGANQPLQLTLTSRVGLNPPAAAATR